MERGTYRVTSNATSTIQSAFLFGNKNVSVIGASAKDCILVYGPAEGDEVVDLTSSKLETMLICVAASQRPTLIKRLTFRCSNRYLVIRIFFPTCDVGRPGQFRPMP